MQIKKIEGYSIAELQDEVAKGGKFVFYQYAMSFVFISLRRPSDIYMVKHTENPMTSGLKYSGISLLLGWWGFPWGIIYTIGSFITNFGGGKDVTTQVMQSLIAQQPLSDDTIAKFAELQNK